MSWGAPQWSYGYTLGPSSAESGGDYTTFQDQSKAKGKDKEEGEIGPPGEEEEEEDGDFQPRAKLQSQDNAEEKEDKSVKKPLEEILRGRQPILYCSDQAKMRRLQMEWEQVSETGPPHDKTFCWSLSIGDHVTQGVGNSKKGAKNRAAEEMARKLDALPKVAGMKRQFNHQSHMMMNNGPPRMMMRPPFGMRGGFWGMCPPPHPGHWGMYPPPYQQQQYFQQQQQQYFPFGGPPE